MKAFKQSFFYGIYLFLFLCFVTELNAQNKRFQIGFQSGPFIPSNWQIQGYEFVSYSNGSPTNIISNGFGDGFDLNLSLQYCFSNWGLNLKSGVRLLENSNDMALAPTGAREEVENKLQIFPITVTLIDKIYIKDSKLTPYLGMGSGVLIASWSQKDFPEAGTRTWLEGSANPVDFHFLAGFVFPIYYDLVFNGEIAYNYASTTWEIENVDTGDITEYRDLNIGGVALKVGLAFRF